MQILCLLIFSTMFSFGNQKTESPHGSGFKISCNICHSSKGWELDKEIYSFNHSTTSMPLTGQHKVINCRECHITLIFSDAKPNCSECHTDIHQSTAGQNCSRCHTPESWLVPNAIDLHQTTRFPLVGAHRTADCIQCHKSENFTRIDIQGVNCIDCHRNDYLASTSPNHIQSGISEDCIQCHSLSSVKWTGTGFNHSAFPLSLGHSTVKCNDCHKNGNYSATPITCYSCHQVDYTSTTSPNHLTAGYSANCVDCHTTTPGWKPAVFNHTTFPLTLGHSTPLCADCHKSGNYSSTSKVCYSCHQTDYTASKNPNHLATAFPTTCETCHTTAPGWKPATFNHTTFPLTLGHATPLCADCHKGGNYTTTSALCYSCHTTDYNNTTNPKHSTLSFATTCNQCHTTVPGWKPATYTQHDAQFFPIYSGRHKGQWTTCIQCHPNTANYLLFECKVCHSSVHKSNNYTNAQCYNCHPRGTSG